MPYGSGVLYAPSISGTSGTTGAAASALDTSRTFSTNVWKDCPFEDYLQGFGGCAFYDDFIVSAVNSAASAASTGPFGQWSGYFYQGALMSDGQAEGGVIKIGSDGDNEGAALLSQSGSFRFITTSTLAYNQKMWFEARVARSSVATAKGDFFVGLMNPTLSSGLPATAQPITTTDDTLMTAGDFFGFHSTSSTATRGGPTEWAVAFELASGTINYPTNLTTLVASTGNTALAGGDFVKLGWVFDPRPNSKKIAGSATARQTAGNLYDPVIKFYVNGVEAATFLASVDVQNATSGQAFPTSFMCPVMAVMNTTGSSPPTLNIDWIRVAQRANS